MVLDCLPRGSANANFERSLPAIVFVAGKFVLNPGCAFNCCRRRQEGSHNAVAGVLDLATTQIGQRVSNNSVVQIEQSHSRLITESLSQHRRLDNICEENGPAPG